MKLKIEVEVPDKIFDVKIHYKVSAFLNDWVRYELSFSGVKAIKTPNFEFGKLEADKEYNASYWFKSKIGKPYAAFLEKGEKIDWRIKYNKNNNN